MSFQTEAASVNVMLAASFNLQNNTLMELHHYFLHHDFFCLHPRLLA